MKKLLVAMFVALLMVGCGGRRQLPAGLQIPPSFQLNAHSLKKGMTEKEVNSLLGDWRKLPTFTSQEKAIHGISANASESGNKGMVVHYTWGRPVGHPDWLTDSYNLTVDFDQFGRLRYAQEMGTYLNGLHNPRTAAPRIDSHSRTIVSFP
jgi:hypothetical protein